MPRGYRYHSRTSVTFPVAANIISVITEGARTQGSLEVSQTADAGSDAVVEIDVFYRHQEDFDEATVCRLHPANNEWGLGIFVRVMHPHSSRSHLHDTVDRLRRGTHLTTAIRSIGFASSSIFVYRLLHPSRRSSSSSSRPTCATLVNNSALSLTLSISTSSR